MYVTPSIFVELNMFRFQDLSLDFMVFDTGDLLFTFGKDLFP